MRIAVDAMGSDSRPAADVEGAVQAAREYADIQILLVGDKPLIEVELAKHDVTNLSIQIVHAQQVVTMEDKPSRVVRGKPESSMAMAMRLVKTSEADAFVTAGNTGAVLAYAVLSELKRMDKVARPAFPAIIPLGDKHVIVTDSGANANCQPEWLVQFAAMSCAYAEKVLEISNPRVALLSNGEEEGKGNELIRDANKLLATTDMNFVGNVEPKDIMNRMADVVICDGFTGNVFIKTLEAMGSHMFGLLRKELTADLRSKLGAGLARPAFRRVYHEVDPFEIGGAPLLGVNGIVIVGHGRTNAKGMKNAINQARQAVNNHIVDVIRDRMSVIAESAVSNTGTASK